MSNRYKGGVISATPPTLVAGAGASGTWTLEQQMQATAAGLWPVNGPFYIEDVFSTYLYAGNDSTQTIANNIDISTKGALVWVKGRSGTYGVWDHTLITTPISNTVALSSNTTGNTFGLGASAFSPTTTGFNLNTASAALNNNGTNYASWTFRKQPKFFDVVTYTGTGSVQNISHNLGSAPACMIVKDTTNAGSAWAIYHTTLGNTQYLQFTTSAAGTSSGYWNNTSPTSTQFTVGTNGNVNQSGATYVAYLFAHNAGGFGLTGTDNVISCGSYSGTGSPLSVTLGYEPQWILVKRTSTAGNDWILMDTMRGMSLTQASWLYPNTSAAEADAGVQCNPTATGFDITSTGTNLNGGGSTYIYIAIRRGPMRVPTSGTSVYNAISRTGTGSAATITGIGFAPDLLDNQRTTAGSYTGFFDRLRGGGNLLYRALTDAETTVTGQTTQFNTTMDGFAVGSSTASDSGNNNTVPYIWHCFKRAPSFFDEVCYTGTGVANTAFTHNLTVTPELMIVKPRSAATAPNWRVWSPINSTDFNLLQLSTDGAASSSLYSSSNVFPAIPTATTFTVGGSGSIQLNQSGQTFVAYLFATCAGVSKVGSYTGTGALQTVNCGFAAGARFILIKRTDSTGDWYVYDSTRGITSGNDPYLLWNTTGAEVTGTDYINTASVGFQVTATAPAGLNASGGTYIFLAIA